MEPPLDKMSDKPWLKSYPPFVDWDAKIRPERAYEGFKHSLATYPNQVCMEFLGRTWTYRETGEMVRCAAKGLQDMGFGKKDRIALMLPNTPYYLVLFHAVLLVGGVVVNINPLYAPHELDELVRDSRPRILVTMDLEAMYPKAWETVKRNGIEKLFLCSMADILPWRKAVLFNLFSRRTLAQIDDDERQVWFEDLIENDGSYQLADVNCQDDVAILQYTGGTTGIPKAAMLTHANLSVNAMQVLAWNNNNKFGEVGGCSNEAQLLNYTTPNIVNQISNNNFTRNLFRYDKNYILNASLNTLI